jgi:long-chain acyl-CoA synthetase
MQPNLKCRTLIELFDQAVTGPDLAQKNYLEIVRTSRRENLTFGRLQNKAREFAAHLILKRNIRPRDKIAILGKNRADWDIALWGIILAGAVPVLIDPERPTEGVKKHLSFTDTKLLILADDYQDANTRRQLKEFLALNHIPLIEMTVYDAPAVARSAISSMLTEIAGQIRPDDTVVILCTSGTTDEPREVELTHTNLIANMQGTLDVVSVTHNDKLGHIMPPHHSFGLTVGKLIPLWVGATNLYTDKYRHISQLIKNKRITIFIGIPALFSLFAKKIEEIITEQKQKSTFIRFADRYLPKLVGTSIIKSMGWDSLRFFVSGAAPVPKWVLQVFWRRGLQLWEGYGTTENSPVCGFNPNPQKLGSVGKPVSTLSVKIVNDRNQTLGPGQKGEILLRGPCVMKGYYKNPKATDEVIKTDENGVRWLHTGDLGHLDKDGHLFITGRKKYLIVLPGGKNVNPELVELALSNAPYVQELVVVPGWHGPDGDEQEAVKAIVRPDWDRLQADTKLSRNDLVEQPDVLKDLLWKSINKCQQESQDLAGFEKIPSKKLIDIEINEFQKTSTGKIKRSTYIPVSPGPR